jgi:hypothetical protein
LKLKKLNKMKKLIFISVILILLYSPIFSQNVGIGAVSFTPNQSSILELDGTSGLSNGRGLLIPRMTQAQRLAMNPLPQPAQGLTVYQIDQLQGFYYDTSTTIIPGWVYINPLSGGSGWLTTGNTGTNPLTNFVGTIDNNDLVFKTNGTEWVRLKTNGRVGVGTTNPVADLEINGVDGLLVTGTFGNGAGIISGSGTRLIWNPKTAIFRAGRVTGNQWDPGNVGTTSVAFGEDSKASGISSCAIGQEAVASGDYSFSANHLTVSSGESSTSFGSNTRADALGSFSAGLWNIGGGTSNSFVLTDPIFEIGIGSSGTPKNAITVLKNGNVGIGSISPKTLLHLQNGDLYIDKSGGGVYMKSPNGNCWLLTVTNAGLLQIISVICP